LYEKSALIQRNGRKAFQFSNHGINKKEELLNYMKNMSGMLANGKKNSDYLLTAKQDEANRRKSFTGLPLPSTYDEISSKLDPKSAAKPKKHVNAV